MQTKTITVLAGVSLLAFVLAGCSTAPVHQPRLNFDNAHNGGSVLAFDHRSRLLASGGWEGNLRLWQLPGGKLLQGWRAHTDSVNGIYFFKSGRRLVTAGYDGRIKLWTTDGSLLRTIDAGAPVTRMKASWKTDRLLAGHSDGSVSLWRLRSLTLLARKKLHRGAVRAVALHPGRALYASSGTDGQVFVWRRRGKPRRMQRAPTDSWTLAFSPRGRQLVGGGWFKLFYWRLGDASLKTVSTRHKGIIKSLQFSADGKSLATISRQTDSAVYILDAGASRIRYRLAPHKLCGSYLRYSPDDRYLATTSDDASVRIFDMQQVRRQHRQQTRKKFSSYK